MVMFIFFTKELGNITTSNEKTINKNRNFRVKRFFWDPEKKTVFSSFSIFNF